MSGLLLALALGACTSVVPPPSTPPIATTPPPVPPPREVVSAIVSGQVRSPRGQPVAHALVLVRAADASCRETLSEVGATTDERGEFAAVAEVSGTAARAGCVLVDARNGGATGSSTARTEFTAAAPPVRADVRLDPPTPLTFAEADRLVRLLAASIDNPAHAAADLSLFVQQGPEALRVAVDQLRTELGSIARVTPEPASPLDSWRYSFVLHGTSDRTARIDVHDEDLIRLRGLALDYGYRSERLVHAYIRAISNGDAVALSRVLNPDDIDVPVEVARDIIIDYRRRYADTARIRAEFVAFDEQRHSIRWRLRGPGASGGETTELLELRTGDGLVGIHRGGV